MQPEQTDAQVTTDTTPALPSDAVDRDGEEIFESTRGVRFLSSPEAKFANVPAPTPEEIERDSPFTVDYEDEPVCLIDASVFPVSSGIPVLLYGVGTWRFSSATVAGDRVLFLGVLSSVFYREKDGTIRAREVPTGVEPGERTGAQPRDDGGERV